MGGKTVVLGLSGGVDSAVAARLLQEQGYTVYGHWLDIGLGGREDAQQVAETFGIPFSAGDIRRELEASVMGPFQRDYLAGRTPLPLSLIHILVSRRRRWNGGEPWLAQPGPHFLGRNGGKNPRGKRFFPLDSLLWWVCGGRLYFLRNTWPAALPAKGP